MACLGVDSLHGERVTATGWVHVRGDHVVRRDLGELVRLHGGEFHQEVHAGTTLVVMGEWRAHQLQDDREGGVDAIDQVARSRREGGPHVHLVRQDDLAALLDGERVPCRRVPQSWTDMQKKARRPTRRQRPYS